MRPSLIANGCVGLLLAAFAAPSLAQSMSAQSGRNRHRAADSSQTAKNGQTVNITMILASDSTLPADQSFKGSTTVSSGETPAEETLSNRRVPAITHVPLALKWEFNDKRGYAQFVLWDSGMWQLSGDLDGKESGRDLEVVFALKVKSGDVFLFHSTGKAQKGRHIWGGIGGTSADLAYLMPVLAPGFELRAAYRLPTKAEGAAVVKEGTGLVPCKTTASMAAGWGSLWTWMDPHKKCVQFNALY